jgi:carbon-monoxide dehydrogenase small subunit
MLAVHLLETKSDADEDQIRDALSANLCRCTGYVNIERAVKAAAAGLASEAAASG